MKKVLVLGATGLFGTPLSIFLKQQNYDVVRHGFRSNADYQADLRKQSETVELLNKVKPDIVVNLIALTNVDHCEEDMQTAYLFNVRPVENLIPWMEMHRNVKLIHLSTDQVYDGTGPHAEENVVLRNIYAFSKYCAEKVTLQVNGCVLRTNFFGKSLLPDRLSFSDWLVNSLKQKKAINLFTDVFFSPLSMTTLQRMIKMVIDNHKPGVFNLGSHDGMSKRDFCYELARYAGIAIENATDTLSTNGNLEAYRPVDMRMDCSLFEKTFGVKLPKLSEEIKDTAREYELQLKE